MVSRLTRASSMCLLATVFLLMSSVLVCQTSAGKEKKDVSAPPAVSKADPKIEADRMLEKAFGGSSDELRRPIRLWIPDIGIAISAEEFSVIRDNRVRLATISVAVIQDVNGAGTAPEINVHRGDDALITLDRPATQWSELGNGRIMTVEVRGKQSSIILTPSFQGNDAVRLAELETLVLRDKRAAAAQELFAAQALVAEKKDAELKRSVATRFKFTFDPKTPLAALLPAPAKVSSKLPPPLNEDLR